MLLFERVNMNPRETSGEKRMSICLVAAEKEGLRWVIKKRSNEHGGGEEGERHVGINACFLSAST